jgi:hypothetical protein
MVNRLTPISAALLAPVEVVTDLLTPRSLAPRSFQDLSPRWLEQALSLPAGAVTGSAAREIDHGTSLRVRLEVFQGDHSTTVFVKQTPTRIPARLFNIAARLCQHEVHFYRHWASESGCAPNAVAAQWHSPTARSTLVLPDLRSAGFEFLQVADRCTPDQTALAVETFARLHRRFWNSRRFSDTAEYLPANSLANVGTPLLCHYLGSTPETIGRHVPPAFAAEARILRTRARAMNPLFNSFDQTLLHNDSHQGNIAFRYDRAVLIDWQICIIGSALKDFAYFMSTVDTDVRRVHERELLGHYLDVLAAGDGPVIAWDDAWRAYQILAITGFIAAATTALFGDRLQNPANAEAGLERTATALIDLESFKAVRQQLDN